MKLFILLLTMISLYSNQISVKAKSLTYTKNNELLKLAGEVKIRDDFSSLQADIAQVVLANNTISSYEAHGNINFSYQNKTKAYTIASRMVSFNVQEGRYILQGDVYLEEKGSSKIKAEKIVIDAKDGNLEIKGGDNPINLEFEISK